MNLQTRYPTTPDEFLRWNEGREGKREFVRGRVVELMINNSRRHAMLALRFGSLLARNLAYPEYTVGTSDVSVLTPDGVRYPDVFVNRETQPGSDMDLSVEHPILLAEVLSPSSYGRDFVEKLDDYRALSPLLHYVILSQEEPRAWVWSRQPGGEWSDVVEVEGRDAGLGLPNLHISIAMAELYAGMEPLLPA